MSFSFKVTKDDIAKSQKCPPGMHIAELTLVGEEYLKDNGNTVQECEFTTTSGHNMRYWFNAKMVSSIIEFVCAADKVEPAALEDKDINLKEYVGKKVCISVSHGKDKNNKIQAQIDNFFSADKVPF